MPWWTQQLGDGLLVETVSLVPPLAILALLTLFQDQRVVQQLVEGVCVKRNPLAPYPRAHVTDTFFGGPGIGLEFQDNFEIELSHRWYKLSPSPLSYLLLEVSVFINPQLDPPLPEERPSFDGLETLRNRWLSKSWAALEPSPDVSFLDLFVESFFGAITYRKQTFRKLFFKELSFHKLSLVTVAYKSFWKWI